MNPCDTFYFFLNKFSENKYSFFLIFDFVCISLGMCGEECVENSRAYQEIKNYVYREDHNIRIKLF